MSITATVIHTPTILSESRTMEVELTDTLQSIQDRYGRTLKSVNSGVVFLDRTIADYLNPNTPNAPLTLTFEVL